MSQSISKSGATLATLYMIVGVIGIGFGAMLILTGLFVVPHVLIGGAIHIVFGVAYVFAGNGMRQRKVWASPIASVCSLIITFVASIAVYQSLAAQETDILWIWILFTIYFLCLSVLSLHQWLWDSAGDT